MPSLVVILIFLMQLFIHLRFGWTSTVFGSERCLRLDHYREVIMTWLVLMSFWFLN